MGFLTIFYTSEAGALLMLQELCSEAQSFLAVLQTLSNRGYDFEQYTWFRNTLPLKMDSVLQPGDRLVALKEARLPPAHWRAQRVLRVRTQ